MIIGLLVANTGFGFADPSTWAYDAAYWARTEVLFQKIFKSHYEHRPIDP